MNFNVLYTNNFRQELKRLSKKYTSLRNDIRHLITSLEENPVQGDPLGKDCYKIRISITSKARGKSSGARVITCVKFINNEVHLLTIYDKSEKEDVSDNEIKEFLREIN